MNIQQKSIRQLSSLEKDLTVLETLFSGLKFVFICPKSGAPAQEKLFQALCLAWAWKMTSPSVAVADIYF